MSRLTAHGLLRTAPGRIAAGLVAVLALAVVAAVVALWPRGDAPRAQPLAAGDLVEAEVVEVSRGSCERWAGPGCRIVAIELRSGPAAGERSSTTLPGEDVAPAVDVGDRIRVARNVTGGLDPALADQLPLDDPSQQPFAFVDFERRSALLVLGLLFAGLVVLLGRWHGVRALLGLAISLLLVIEFLVPAIVDGRSPLLVALVGALAVMLVTIGLSHGVGLTSLAAILGTAVALAVTAALALVSVHGAEISGFSDEQAALLLAGTGSDISLQGLVLAGMVIGALGVLDDVTVSQASTVLALRRANPELGAARLFRAALAVGRDHLGATVNTLVLAYAGAALPALLIFNTQATPFGEAVNREPVAAQIVAMLVGSIGLIAAVPLTTAVAALLARNLPSDAVPDAGHGHVH